ncbi:MAG TPA: SMP-30/gluconolactonase/LRE family protein [bacterium]|nr:SMP-30/gluconolactonase/LRE family protein [bacterium]
MKKSVLLHSVIPAILLSVLVFIGCQHPSGSTIGQIERVNQKFDELISENAEVEVLAEGFDWAEGPVWIPDQNKLLFSDIPGNTIYAWSDQEGLEVFLRPAGYMWADPPGEELGTNGLVLDPRGRLVMCDHGNRAIVRLNQQNYTRTVLADNFNGNRLNSPNDAVFKSGGDLYFTDPPYGLENLNDSPRKELDVNGVYRLTSSGELELLIDDLTFPNGIAFSPTAQKLYVAISDPDYPRWMVYDVLANGEIGGGTVFYDATKWHEAGRPGLPDGMTVDKSGNLFATGPGGIHVFSATGIHLGTISTGQATANCTFGGPNGTTLFITADLYLCKVETNTVGLGF